MSQLADGFATEEVFESAVSIVRNLPKEGPIKPSDELKLKFYAFFKQATHGPNDTPKPRFYQLVELYKWDAWRKLADMSREEAMSNYILELKQVMESIPGGTNEADGEHFREVLGQRFYDYWFKSWAASKQQHLDKRLNLEPSSRVESLQSDLEKDTGNLIEEDHDDDLDFESLGSTESRSFAQEFSDQFAAAILRLHSSLLTDRGR